MMERHQLFARLCEAHEHVKKSQDPFTALETKPVTSLLMEVNPRLTFKRMFERLAKDLLIQTRRCDTERAVAILFPLFAMCCTKPERGNRFGNIYLPRDGT